MKITKRLLMAVAGFIALTAGSQPAIAGIGLGINAGLEVAPLVTSGVDVFYDMGQFTFGAHYAAGSGDLTSLAKSVVETDAVKIDKLEASTSVLSFDARMFLIFGMNFFVGVGQRTLDMDFALQDSTLGVNIDGSFKTKSTISRMGFGTMGRFGVFYVGMDLAAVHLASGGSSDATINTPIPAAATELSAQFDELADFSEDSIAKGTTVGVAIFSVGALL